MSDFESHAHHSTTKHQPRSFGAVFRRGLAALAVAAFATGMGAQAVVVASPASADSAWDLRLKTFISAICENVLRRARLECARRRMA